MGVHPKPSSRLTRWTIRLQGFDFEVKYRKGKCSVVPDALSRSNEETNPTGVLAVYRASRMSENSIDLPVEWNKLAEAKQEDPEVKELMSKVPSVEGRDPKRIHYTMVNGYLFRSVPTKQHGQKFQLIIPKGHWK